MRSNILWMTDLGLVKIDSGELSPGLDPIELRFYPKYGWGAHEWDFEIGAISGDYPVKYIGRKKFVADGNYFTFNLCFKELNYKSKICILATHVTTNFKQNIWEGEILPNNFTIESKIMGLTNQNWDIFETLKMEYPNLNPKHFAIPKINVIVNKHTIIASQANSVEEHSKTNVPVLFKNFHQKQEFKLEIFGHLYGYGGMGGNAGISTVTDEVDIIYPTKALNGGNVVYVEHNTQSLKIYVHYGATYFPGIGGKGASSFLINCPEKRVNQIGQPGLGGYPNGLNGKFTDIHYKLKLIKENTRNSIEISGKNNYIFKPGKIIAHDLPSFIPANKSIASSEDGRNGILKPEGVTLLVNNGNSLKTNQLIYFCGGYMSD